jgi:hypothetical protein
MGTLILAGRRSRVAPSTAFGGPLPRCTGEDQTWRTRSRVLRPGEGVTQNRENKAILYLTDLALAVAPLTGDHCAVQSVPKIEQISELLPLF